MKKLFLLLPFLFAFISCDLVTDKEYFVSVNPNHSFSWFNGSAVCYNFNCDVIQYKEKQKEKIEDPKYQQGSKGPKNFEGATSETTWCNMSTLGITFDTCYELSMALRNENDIYGENTNANAMYDNLAKAAAKEGSRIVEITTPEMAQKLANKGYTVVG